MRGLAKREIKPLEQKSVTHIKTVKSFPLQKLEFLPQIKVPHLHLYPHPLIYL